VSAAVPARRALASTATALLLAALVVHGVVQLARRRADLLPLAHPDTRDLAAIAATEGHLEVRGRLATYYLLADRIAGATLRVPPGLAEVAWPLERFGRVRVEVSRAPLRIDPARRPALDAALGAPRPWARGAIEARHGTQELRVGFEPGARAYVLAESADGRALYLVTAARFAEVAAP
jgi:hypothetical protein